MQCLLELLLLFQVSEKFPADSLQALHLQLALVHLTFQGLHSERQLGTESQGFRGEQRRSREALGVQQVCGFVRERLAEE